ncbi:MAG: hypothetical protein ACSHX9_07505 [Luteolibacter sp.]
MNNRLLRVIVLLVSITGAGTYVWFSSQQGKPTASSPPPEKTATGEENVPSTVAEEEIAPVLLPSSKSFQLLPSSKSKQMLSPEDLDSPIKYKEKLPALPTLQEENTITDEEVQERIGFMISGSKSLLVLSEEEVRKLMEKEAKEKAPKSGQQED